MHEIIHLSKKLEKGTILITLTKGVESLEWKIIDKF
jgi:hypothetical protein